MSKKEEQAAQLLQKISTAYAAKEVQELPELKELLFVYAQELDKTGNTPLIATKLNYALQQYATAHSQHFPKPAADLFYQTVNEAKKYEGIAASAVFLPLWF